MYAWPPLGKKKFETLSYLPPLSQEYLAKEVEYLLRKGWIPCLEFPVDQGFVYRENHRSPATMTGDTGPCGCYVGMHRRNSGSEGVNAFIRIIGFDNVRQVQCISFIAYKPSGY